jgi:hypothetical protein
MEHNRVVDSSAKWLAFSSTNFSANKAQLAPVIGDAYTKALVGAEMHIAEALATEAQKKIHSITALEADQSEPIPAASIAYAKTAVSSMAAPTKETDTGTVKYMANVLLQSSVSTAWYPPIWTNGGLWIRQSHSVTQNEIGELVIT